MSTPRSRPVYPEFTSEDTVTWIVVSAEELAALPPGTLTLRRNEDPSHLPKDLLGKVVYVEGVEHHTRRPMSEEFKRAIREYWRRLGREEPPYPVDPQS
jgi:hypothetical protein